MITFINDRTLRTKEPSVGEKGKLSYSVTDTGIVTFKYEPSPGKVQEVIYNFGTKEDRVILLSFKVGNIFLKTMTTSSNSSYFTEATKKTAVPTLAYVVDSALAKFVVLRDVFTLEKISSTSTRKIRPREYLNDVIRDSFAKRFVLYGDVFSDMIPFKNMLAQGRDFVGDRCYLRGLKLSIGVDQNGTGDTPLNLNVEQVKVFSYGAGGFVDLKKDGNNLTAEVKPGIYEVYWSDFSVPYKLPIPFRFINLNPTSFKVYVV